jgi:hypothetical protein
LTNCFRRAADPFALEIAMTMPVRAALYLRVSTGRQADNDLSIPDQRRQAKGYCASRGWEIVADYVEPGLSATDDRRPEFQRMIDAATTKQPAFDVILVHSFSRFFRDQFQLEFYVRRLAKAGATGSQNVCQDSPQAHADRWRRLPPRSPARAGSAHRSRCQRSSHHGLEKLRTLVAASKRKNGGFWSAQFCTEVARPERFERPTLRFVV